LIDDKGLIVTSNHVVSQAVKAKAKFRDGKIVNVKGPRAVDEKRDLAIIELESTPAGTAPLPLGPRTPPRAGESATAIGHPRGLEFSATSGIVSGIRRSSDQLDENGQKVKPEDDITWIQTDAALIPGNSGGPLLSAAGEVLGVNALSSPEQGIGFAVHVSHVIDLLARARREKTGQFAGEPSAADVENPLARFQPQVGEMYTEYTNAYREWQRMIQGARTQIEQATIINTQNPGPKYAKRFFQIAEQRKGKLTGFQGLYFACVADEPSGPATYLKQAIERIERDHIKDKGLHHAIPGIATKDHAAVTAFLRKVVDQSPGRDNKGLACLYLASRLKEQPQFKEAEVLGLLKRCAGEFKDVRLEDVPLAKYAEPMIFEIEHLSVGKSAPEIVGVDARGKPLKLSEFRGKVVLLDFFADWCPYCVRMYPEERELIKSMGDQHFAMLGVNCDSTNTLRQIIEDGKVTWRCWDDGKSGPIAEKWQVASYPTMFIIDHDGVIRHKLQGMSKPGLLKETVSKLVRTVPGYRIPIREAKSLTGHATSETVEFAAISPDGKRVLSASADRMVFLWDRTTGQVIQRFRPAGGRILSALFSPDGNRAFTAGEDKTIRLWDLKTGKLVREFKGHTEWVFSLAFSPDGKTAYSTSGGPDIWHEGKDSAVRVWEVETGHELRRLEGHKGRVLSVDVSPDGRQILTGGDRRVILWDATSGKMIRQLEGHNDLMSRVSFLPDGKRAVSSSFDRTIRLWDLNLGKEIQQLVGHPHEVTWFAISPDGRLLLSSDFNAHELRLWDLSAKAHVDRVDLGTVSPTRGSFSPDGRFAVWPGTGGTLRVYEIFGAQPARSLADAAKPAGSGAPGATPAGLSR
jgi:WD40 repeat protein